MQCAQDRLVARSIAAVLSRGSASVTEVVLGIPEDRERSTSLLKAVRVRDAHRRRQLDGLAERLIGSAPVFVARHRHDRREGEVGTDAGGLVGDDAGDLLDQRRITGGAQPDIVRKHRGAVDGTNAVNDVEPVDDGDFKRLTYAARRNPSAMSAQLPAC